MGTETPPGDLEFFLFPPRVNNTRDRVVNFFHPTDVPRGMGAANALGTTDCSAAMKEDGKATTRLVANQGRDDFLLCSNLYY